MQRRVFRVSAMELKLCIALIGVRSCEKFPLASLRTAGAEPLLGSDVALLADKLGNTSAPMIMEQTMQTQQQSEQEFLSNTYRGRAVAIFNHHGRWLVYLDHVLQQNMAFATAQDALSWLLSRVDHGVPARLH